MKRCCKCKAEKPIGEYWANKSTIDKKDKYCISCRKESSSKNEKRKSVMDKRVSFRKTEIGRKMVAKINDKWRKNNPEKHSAHLAVRKAVKNGDIVKGLCEVCNSNEVEGHHDDYGKPLNVRWLCKEHHIEAHNGKFG